MELLTFHCNFYRPHRKINSKMVGSAERTNMKILDIIFYIYTTMCLFGNAQVIFQLQNSETNEVVFVQERAITFECSYNGSVTTDVIVQIEGPDGRVLVAGHQVMPVEYVIQEVTMENRGVYTCRVTYMNGRVSHTETLILNVQDDSLPRCFSNGTVGQPYKPGDWLLLSCYCREEDICRWSSSVVGRQGTILTPHEEIEKTEKTIVRVLVHYTSETDNTTRYDCFRSSSERCSIGPLVYSSIVPLKNPFESYATSTQHSDLKEGISRGMITKDMVTDTNNMMTDDGSNQLDTSSFPNVVAVITGCLASLLTIVVVVLLAYIFVLRRDRDKEKGGKSGEKRMKGNIHPHKRDDYSTAIYNTASQQSNLTVNDMANYESVSDNDRGYDTPEVEKTDVQYSSKIYLSSN